jgi:hypothetical protein
VLSGCRRCVVAVAAGRSPALLDEFRMDLDVFSGDSTPEVQAALARGAKGPLFRYAEVGSESGRSADQMCGFCRLTGAVLAISFLCAPPKQLCRSWLKSAPCFWHTCPQLHQSGDIITRRIRVRSSSAGVRCGTPMEHNAAAVLPHSGRSLQAWGFIGASRVGSGASFLYTAGVRMNVVTSGTIGNPHDPPGTASLCQTNSEWIGAHVPNTCAVTVAMPVFAPQAICPLENS